MPSVPTLPLHHGWRAAHSIASCRSSASWSENGSVWPGDLPEPRPSTRTAAYPRGTHQSGLTVSQFIYGLSFSSRSSGGVQCLSFWYEPRLMIAGNFPAPRGRNTSALRRTPSHIGTSRSFSMCRRYFACDNCAMAGNLSCLIKRDIVIADHRRPFGDFLVDEFRVICGRLTGYDRNQLLAKRVFHFGRVHDLQRRRVDLRKQRRRHLCRGEQAIPGVGTD